MSTTPRRNYVYSGLIFASVSAFSFGISSPVAKSLIMVGWSPAAAAAARFAGGALSLAIVATLAEPQWVREAREHATTVLVYGAIPLAGYLLCHYNAVAHLSVGVALLLEYASPVLVIAWVWATTLQRPRGLTLAGAAVVMVGVTLVLDVFHGAHVDPVGVAWALGAAAANACYFVMSGQVNADGSGLHAITLAAGGLVVATVVIAALGLTGIMPIQFSANDALMADVRVPWLVPVLLLGILCAVANILGVSGIARLRPSFASIVGLSEVLFAVLAAWMLLNERMSLIQLAGGTVMLAGLALAAWAAASRTSRPLGVN